MVSTALSHDSPPSAGRGAAERTRSAAPRRRRGRPDREGLAGYAFLSPWILGFLLLTMGPMLASLYLSFTDYNLFTAPEWVGLDNYRALFRDDQWLQSVRVTLVYVTVSVPLKLAGALAVAMLLVRPRRGQGFYRSAFYAPSLLGASVSVALVWRALFSDDAVVDRALSSVGIDTGGWVGNPDYALGLLILLAVWQFGAPMVIFLAGLKQVPRELYEAADVDGAGRLRKFGSITLPMISPVLFFNLLLETVNAFQVFTSSFVVSNGTGGPAGSTLFYTLYLYQQGFTQFRMGYASAMAWMLVLGAGLVAVLLFRLSRAWVYYSGDDGR
ncbi:multiple sugar transport system permease protein [Spinactinospora alkalitolerans]|uniref:Multiple sugar transport system permease protein n=1 Tax=Spinactinospora alkalitolerans TaxID=687207 RepID=A0A852TSY4_9ACTN|nr:sugar ABC transporter permease [Spinactinospora alkalitolerans]NYE46751.1 multiple sugar transport system permease protein [Spinactinospora alkalitolerans]